MKGLYVHIPFCKQICSYCDFPKQVAKKQLQEEYVKHLLEELREYHAYCHEIRSVYIGGGTPNHLSLSLLTALLEELAPFFKNSLENTIEINSELLTKEQAVLFKQFGINRISIGVQTFSNDLIQKIRRNHTKNTVLNAIKILREVGFNNINLDMMYGLPGQTLKDVAMDVEELLELKPQHISYYSLILEEKTILSYQLNHHQITLPDDDLVADMANYITQKLKLNAFKHYEISNFALEGYESIHNIGYWKCEEYIGVGAGACSFIDSYRIQNHFILPKYFKERVSIKEWISSKEAKSEYMMLGFRLTQGIKKEDYLLRFHHSIEEDFDLSNLFQKNLIEEVDGYIRIKEDKLLLGNLVFEEFVR